MNSVKRFAKFTIHNTNASWYNVPRNICKNKNVYFERGYDNLIKDTFPYAQTVIFNDCDKNFFNYNFNKKIFPKVKTVITNCHPNDFYVLNRYSDVDVYLHERWHKLFPNWIDKINLMDDKEYKLIIKNLYFEEPEFEV